MGKHVLVIAAVLIFRLLCYVNCQDPRLIHNLLQIPQQIESLQEDFLSSNGFETWNTDDWARSFSTGNRLSATPSTNASMRCLNDTFTFINALNASEPWALQMIDAAGKIGSGILQGHLLFPGSFDECLAVVAKTTINSTNMGLPFHGKHCMVSLVNDNITASPVAVVSGFAIGICMSNSCSVEDVLGIMNSGFIMLPENIIKDQHLAVKCNEPIKYSTKAIIVLVFCGIYVCILLIGTCYDIIFIQIPKSNMAAKKAINGNHNSNTSTVEQVTESGPKHKLRPDEYTPLISGDKKAGLMAKEEPGLLGSILLSFSVYSNGAKILNTSQSSGMLTCVHGMRFLSLTWVILGHTYVFGLSVIDNAGDLLPLVKRFTFQAIINATLSVDSFFFLSGMLVAYLTLKELAKNDGKLNWFMFYFHRIWRLTPPYMLILLVYVSLFPYVADGPFWPKEGIEYDDCSHWWTNILYINNFVDAKKMCMSWSWYLSNDMQFYILSPLIIVPLFYSAIVGTAVLAAFMLATLITSGVISSVYGLTGMLNGVDFSGIVGAAVLMIVMIATMTSAGVISSAYGLSPGLLDLNTFNDYFYEYYIMPYCRIGPYLIGIATGYILYRTKCRYRLRKWMSLIGWSISISTALAIIYGLYESNRTGIPVSLAMSALYNSVSRTCWAIALAWVMFACTTGHGGYVNTILSWKGFIPLSRLSFCAYLIHPVLMFVFYESSKKVIHFTDMTIVMYFLGFTIASYAAAFILSLAFESPMMGLEKAIFKREKRS